MTPRTAPWPGHQQDVHRGGLAIRNLSSARRSRRVQCPSWWYFVSHTRCVICVKKALYCSNLPKLSHDHVHHDAHSTPKDLAIPLDKWETFYRKAEAIGLVSKITVTSESEPMWRDIDANIKDMILQAALILQGAPAGRSDTFGTLEWMLVRPSFKRSTHSYIMQRDRKLQAGDFTFPKLMQTSPLKNPKENEGNEHVIIICEYA